MMPKLIPKQSQVTYLGSFSKPAFSLWGQGSKTLEELFRAFGEYKISVGDIRSDSSSPNLGDVTLIVHLFDYSASYKFKLDRVEAVFNDLTEEQSSMIPEVLQRGDGWLHSLIPDLSFQSHLITYSSHNQLSEGTAKDFLQGLSNLDIPNVGISQGNGITFHWDIPERNWGFHMGVDLSFNIPNGLFIQFLIRTPDDKIDYVASFGDGLAIARAALAEIGLEL